MSDLIRKSVLYEEISKRIRPNTGDNSGFLAGLSTALSCIDNAPTIEATPVVHGKPVCKNRPEHYYNYELMVQTEDGEPLYKRVHKISENNLVEYCPVCSKRLCSRFRSYCPNCGAKMDL